MSTFINNYKAENYIKTNILVIGDSFCEIISNLNILNVYF
jgi:hypothetical protein